MFFNGSITFQALVEPGGIVRTLAAVAAVALITFYCYMVNKTVLLKSINSTCVLWEARFDPYSMV